MSWNRYEDKVLFLEYVAILPEHQNRGLGSEVVRDVLRSAAERGVPVRLSVLKVNPVRKLYARMGFQTLVATNSDTTWKRSPMHANTTIQPTIGAGRFPRHGEWCLRRLRLIV
jgi:predicted N-acetyltransferase YhbS